MRESANRKPPWTKAEVSDAYFYFKPKLGAEVSVLPLCERPPFRLQIIDIRVDKIDELTRWVARLAPVQDAAYLEPTESVYACNVIVAYPAQEKLASLDAKTLKKGWLPKGITSKHVKVAVDTNSDGKPDALLATYCTENRKAVECYEATATVLYQRGAKGWRKLYTWEPIS